MNTADAITQFLAALRVERNASEHTLRAYSRELARFAAFLGPELRVADIDHKLIRGFLAQLHDDGLAKASVARALATLKSWFKWLGKEGMVGKNPVAGVSAPKLPKRLPRVPTAADLNQAFETRGEHVRFPERDLLILELLYGAGIRNGELCGLRMSDVSLQRQMMRVQGKGKKERIVPFGDAAHDALKRYLPHRAMHVGKSGAQHEMLLVSRRGTPLTTRSVGRIVKRVAVAAGLPVETHPHTLRHAFGTHMLAEGADLRVIQELLGHERLSTTQIYTQLSTEHIARVYDQTHPRAK